jgi:hypothetical protein
MTRDVLIDRLAAANPETVEAPVDEALLARLLAEPGPPPMRRRRRRLTPVIAAGVVVLLAVGAIVARDVLDDGHSRDALAAKVYAALTDDQVIYHSVALTSWRSRPFGGNERVVEEQWTRGDGKAGRIVVHATKDGRRGERIFETAWGPGQGRDAPPGASRPFDPTAGYREAYRRGTVRSRGVVVIRGRRLLRLEARRHGPERTGGGLVRTDQREVFLVDARTLLPVEELADAAGRYRGGAFHFSMRRRYTTYERLPDSAANRRLLRPRSNAASSLLGP